MEAFFIFAWSENIYIAPSYRLNPQLNGTTRAPTLSLPLWVVRVTVGNYMLNVKYGVAVQTSTIYSTAKFQASAVSSRSTLVVRPQFQSYCCFSSECGCRAQLPSGHYAGAAQWRASRTLLRVRPRGKRWEAEVQGGEEECTVGPVRGREQSKMRSGGWKGDGAENLHTDHVARLNQMWLQVIQ